MCIPSVRWGRSSSPNFLDNNFITPKIVGSSVSSINPLASIRALLAGGMLWVWLTELAIPFTGKSPRPCATRYPTEPWGFLLGEEHTRPEEDLDRHPP